MHTRAPRHHRLPTVFGIIAILGLSCLDVTHGSGARAPVTDRDDRDRVAHEPARDPKRAVHVPVTFAENTGRVDSRVRYYAQAGRAAFYFTPESVVVAAVTGRPRSEPSATPQRGFALALRFVGANPRVNVAGGSSAPGTMNYFVGSDPTKWRTGISTWKDVVYHDLWPGIDAVFHDEDGTLKYDFIVKPGGRVEDITLAYDGADALSVDDDGALRIATPLGTLKDAAPETFQEVDGRRVAVASRYVLRKTAAGTQVAFSTARYASDRPLVVDPGLIYSTYLGGSDQDNAFGLVIDALGNSYIAGQTRSPDFPTVAGSYDVTWNGDYDAFIAKLSPDGSSLLFSTFLGGSRFDSAQDIGLDASGQIYVFGGTGSANFPTTPGAYDNTYNGSSGDVYVAKLTNNGSTLLFSTFIGGSGSDGPGSMVVDAVGQTYMTGGTTSTDFPTTPLAYDRTYNGSLDVFVTKLNSTGSALVYSTYLGASDTDYTGDVALDASGDLVVFGKTYSPGFPVTPGAYDTTFNGASDTFVTRLNATGSALVFSTFLGGTSDDEANGIRIDANGQIDVVGGTWSTDFPRTTGPGNRGNGDAFVASLDSNGSVLRLSRLLGSSGTDTAIDLAFDATDTLYVVGVAGAPDFPVTPNAYDTTFNGSTDAFIAKLSQAGDLTYSTFFGGSRDDSIDAIAIVKPDDVIVAGTTLSLNFPTTPNSYDQTYNGGFTDAFVARLDLSGPGPAATVVLTPATDINGAGEPHCVTATVRDAAGTPTPGVAVLFTVSGANAASGTAMTGTDGQATFCYTGTHVGVDTIRAVADRNGNGAPEADEPVGVATKTYVAAAPATLALNPAAATNEVGTQHCVTATLRDAFGNPTPGIVVRFTVTGAAATTGSATTDAAGDATFCYQGPALPGTDAITAFADTNGNGEPDATEPSGAATKEWILPMASPSCNVSVSNGGQITAANGDAASFGGNARADARGPADGQQQYQDHGPAQPLTVHSQQVLVIVCDSDRSATIFGRAAVDGVGSVLYRIRVQDNGEPGKGHDVYSILLDNGYYSGEMVIEGGNIQVRRK